MQQDNTKADRALQTPVLLIVFNRPQTTERVFSAIRKVRPQKLYVAADGPRADKAGEAEKARLTREIATRVDWDCELKTLFRDENVGCGLGPATAISWLFENEEQGIILEDDCQPNESFFWFCEEILERYKHDSRVMQVSGINPLGDWRNDPDYGYYFSEAGTTWGWATWRRAWQSYDYHVPVFKEMLHKGYLDGFYLNHSRTRWIMNCLDEAYHRLPTISWWDYQWEFAKFINSGLSVVPHASLVQNIGFGGDATHTFEKIEFAAQQSSELVFPLRHPPFVLRDAVADKRYHAMRLRTDWRKKIKSRLRRFGIGIG